ncbi:MAG TPA: DUF742 domain-containing protein [Pseudonocardiaceae bacterium]|jgi:hypothetical protein|nr:DUF742 domain-containing protein [Pseudonocardiaceae bacterium]
MTLSEDGPWVDDAAGLLVRPYSVTNGRTRPTEPLDLLSMVRATGRVPAHMEPEHHEALKLCEPPASVSEVAAKLRQPVVVAKVLLSDLIGWNAVSTRAPAVDIPDRSILEALLNGLRSI